ncbi:threonine--tRNA ligase [Buchnera aphidicola]|uniref:Threonine--tRNA ligase n=1 Tax=Buchnera aphidicola subsp. Tuberolachnus salignus TaxID=98804 RepID=A0A160SYR3_BUCTT|nr:threonine--tRNA ligase [Buchnera aphidicola]CUR53066.1 Threonine--tRNA ligase [Buchnera aphidicola (Tuberolachnus salignus)]
MPIITFSTGIKKKYVHNIFLKNIVKEIFKKTKKKYIAGYVNNQLVDLNFLITKDSKIILIPEYDRNFLKMIRISGMQLLNYAVTEIWPNIKKASGMITDEGFYCDFDNMDFVFTTKDLSLIKKKMLYLISKEYNIVFKKFFKKKFLKILKIRKEKYQSFLLKINDTLSDTISVCFHEKYFEECHEVQVPNIKFCKHFFLKNISGAYWLNNEKNKMLQRINVVIWSSSSELLYYKKKKIDAEKRDHRKLAKKLDLYHVEYESPGMIFWHHNGYVIFRQLKTFIRNKLLRNSYQEVKSPIILNQALWKKSGHLENYEKSIFTTNSEHQMYCIKPMNCPGHVQIFKQGLKSYKDLPLRISEFGSCHRKESSGSLHGLMRVRSFTQDDAHIFCAEDQIREELINCIDLILNIYHVFGFKKITVKFSTRPEKRIGSTETWNKAEKDLEYVLINKKLPFSIQKGEGAFYGPKIEISLEDSLKRIWQCGTIQLDFYLSKRLDAFYVNKNNQRVYPVIIHRAILGSMERFIGILIEEYHGKFPFWLAPIQIAIIIISKTHKQYAQKICKKCLIFGIRYSCDFSDINFNLKIKKYITQYVPYIIICGDKEISKNVITVRKRDSNVLYVKNIQLFFEELLQESTQHYLY